MSDDRNAPASRSLFRSDALARVSSPERLDLGARLARPASGWLLGGALLLAAGAIGLGALTLAALPAPAVAPAPASASAAAFVLPPLCELAAPDPYHGAGAHDARAAAPCTANLTVRDESMLKLMVPALRRLFRSYRA